MRTSASLFVSLNLPQLCDMVRVYPQSPGLQCRRCATETALITLVKFERRDARIQQSLSLLFGSCFSAAFIYSQTKTFSHYHSLFAIV